MLLLLLFLVGLVGFDLDWMLWGWMWFVFYFSLLFCIRLMSTNRDFLCNYCVLDMFLTLSNAVSVTSFFQDF